MTCTNIMSRTATKLHIGCFDQSVKGWINTDITPHILIAKVPGLARLLFILSLLPRTRYDQHRARIFHDVRYLDVRKRFRFPAEAIDYVYSSHLIEHLYPQEAAHCLAEIYRVLRPGGILRIAVPDLDVLVAGYDAKASDNFAGRIFESRSKGSKNQHHWMYNEVSLATLLERNGFAHVERRKFREGLCPDLQLIEVREESLFLEAVKAP